MKQTKLLGGMLLLVAQAAAVFSVLTAYSLGSNAAMWLFPGILIPYGALLYLCNRFVLRKPRSVQTLSMFNGVIVQGLIVVVLRCRVGGSVVGSVMTAVVCIVVTVQAVRVAVRGPTLSELLLAVDVNAVGLVLMAGVICLRSLTGVLIWCVPSAVGLVAALCGLISFRMEHLSVRLRIAFCLLLGGLLLLTAGLVVFAAEPAGQGITAVWNGLGNLFKVIWHRIELLMEALARLMPKDRYEEALQIAETGSDGNIQLQAEPDRNLGYLLFYLLLGGVIAAGIAAFFAFGKRLLGREIELVSGENSAHQGVSLKEALRSWLRTWKQRAETRRFLARNRDNAVGVYFRLVRICRNSALALQCGETPATFLTRLSRLDYGEESTIDFPMLIRETDRALFCPSAIPETLPFARELCAAVRMQAKQKSA